MEYDQFKNAEDRLWKLIEKRLEPGAAKLAIDERIWDLFGETWTIMFTDLSGFSRSVVEFGIIHFLQVIHESKRLLLPIVDEHDGFLLKVEGDSFLVLFRNPLKGIQCAIQMQHKLMNYNIDRAKEDQVLLCIGLGHGKVLRIGEHEVFGSEVNAASKLGEDTAKSGEILITDSLKEVASLVGSYEFKRLSEAPSGASGAWQLLY